MPANSVMPPIELFTDTAGNPLDAGFIYIGEPGFDARSTPKAAFFDAALTIACPPAIRTSAGYPVRNGTAATIYVDGNHSMTVTDRNGVVVFSNLSRAFELGTPTTTLAQVVAPNGTLLQTGFGFASDTDTGLIRSASNEMQAVVGGVPIMTLRTTGVTMTNASVSRFAAAGGTLTDLSLSFENRLSVTFTATSATMLAIASAGASHASATATDVIAEFRLFDSVAASEIVAIPGGATAYSSVGYAARLSLSMTVNNMVVGRSYTLRLYLLKNIAAGPTLPRDLRIEGIFV